ncbi:hypothetical protein [Mycolicibacterium houstonense]|uniref:hypothetical protein n=1 Tax=Mycolicibacterium houstonense TaxID=146021 RepID=UPI000834B7A5|nr:hypothetical protein [Mycolicibacterium houstonense]
MKVRYQSWADVPHGALVKSKLLYLIKPYDEDAQPLITSRVNGIGIGWIVSSLLPEGPFKEVTL